MAGVQNEVLTIAACRAGVLGSLPAAMYSAEALDEALAAIRAAVAEAPYNVNFFAHRPPKVSEAQRVAWQALLAPHLARFGLTVADIPADPGRRPFDETALSLLQKHRPPVVSFHFGLPPAPLLEAVKVTGAMVLSSATSVAEARWLEAHGADGIIAQGLEAGGHRGWFLNDDPNAQSGLFALLPNIAARYRYRWWLRAASATPPACAPQCSLARMRYKSAAPSCSRMRRLPAPPTAQPCKARALKTPH